MGSFVILFFFFFLFYFLVFSLLLVNIYLPLSCLLSFFVCFAQIFPWISFYCVLLCTLHEPPYALNLWSSFNLSKMILIPSFFFGMGGWGVGGREGGTEYIILFRHYYSILDAHSINIRKTNKVLRLDKDDTGFTFLPSTLLRP